MILIIDSKKHGRHEVIIDDEDYDKIKNYNWFIMKQRKTYVFRNVRVDGKRRIELLHRRIMNFPPGFIDHIDGNSLNNGKENMRVCNNAENLRNRGRQKNNKSGFKGVRLHSQNKNWVAQIRTNNVTKYIGVYETKEAAALAYNEAAKKYHGEFARLNEISPCL